MAMGIVNDNEFDAELDKLQPREKSNPHSIAKIVDVTRGRGQGNVEVPNTLRKIIGEESATNGRQAGIELAKQFGISPSSVSAYTEGANSTATYDRQPNANFINEGKKRVVNRAQNKLMSALRHITDEKLGEAKVRDLAGIARDMSAVIKNLEPEQPKNQDDKDKPQFVFFAPTFVKEEKFETVYVKD